jgi:excisionase family DNA binding protein
MSRQTRPELALFGSGEGTAISILRAHDFPSPQGRLVDINELSWLLGIPKGTLYNWVYLKRLIPIRFGRSLRFNYDEVIQSHRDSTKMGSAGQR